MLYIMNSITLQDWCKANTA